MLKVIDKPREELSPYAPKMLSTKIDVDKIREVIGKGGSVIQKIQAECNCKIDIEEDGSVFISALNTEDAKRALSVVETIAKDPEIGAIYKGKVTRLMTFGAFVEIAAGQGRACAHQPPRRQARGEGRGCRTGGDEVLVKVTED